MTQRRTPGGQGPARRPARPGRAGASRAGAGRGNGIFDRDPRARDTRVASSPRTGGSGRRADLPRSANRPAAARRATVGAAKRTTAPQPRRFTSRVTVLAAVLIALALAYTYPVRVYLNQQSDIARLEAAQEAQRRHIGKLTKEAALWQDPEYIKIQAKQRFYMVLPGEVPLVVLTDPEGAAREAGVDPAAASAIPHRPWHDTLWASIEAANEGLPE